MNLHSERYGTCEAFNVRRQGMCKAPLDEYGMCAVARDHGDSAEAPREPVRRGHNHDTFRSLCGPSCPRSGDADDFH